MAEPMSIEELRDTAVRLNNPKADVELRQKALTNLFIELCDRFVEMRGALAMMNTRLTEALEAAGLDITQIKEVLTALAARSDTADTVAPAPTPEANSATAQAAAELAQLPTAMQGQVTQLSADGKPVKRTTKPTVVKTPEANGDPASIAAKINNVADVPVVKTIP